jgi:hypothetical protein
MSIAGTARGADVLLVLNYDEGGPPVADAATAVARLTGGEIRPLRVAAGVSPEATASRVLRALHRPGTLTAVLAGDDLSRPLWQQVVQRSAKPVVLVPAGSRQQDQPRIRRVLLPLDGTARSAAAVAPTAERLARGGAELVVLHVFDAETAPKFWDQQVHAGQAWSEEFLARYCNLPGTRLEMRSGVAAEHVAEVAAAEHADMIALAWSQQLGQGHAPVVLRTVLQAKVPVILVPIPAS